MLWDLTTEQWIISFAFACALAFLCGWIADRIMGFAGFGVIGNWLLLLIGAYVGLYVYNRLGHTFDVRPVFTIAVAFGSAAAMLVTLSGIKAATNT